MAAPEELLMRPVEFDWEGHHFICWIDDRSSTYGSDASPRPWPERHHQTQAYRSCWWAEIDGGQHRPLFHASPDDTNESVKPRIIAWYRNHNGSS